MFTNQISSTAFVRVISAEIGRDVRPRKYRADPEIGNSPQNFRPENTPDSDVRVTVGCPSLKRTEHFTWLLKPIFLSLNKTRRNRMFFSPKALNSRILWHNFRKGSLDRSETVAARYGFQSCLEDRSWMFPQNDFETVLLEYIFWTGLKTVSTESQQFGDSDNQSGHQTDHLLKT